jgi:DNA-binding NarL/FixJ family response regulator
MARVLIADDHGLYRKGLRSILEGAIAGLDTCEANCLDAALVALEADGRFDLVIVDLNMPGVISYESLAEARACYPETRFMVVSASNAKEDVLACLAVGVHGFVSKLQHDHEIVGAVEHVLGGAIYVPPWLSNPRYDDITPPRRRPIEQARVCPSSKLTVRQRDLLPLLARGMSNKEIARELAISEATTKIHAAAVCRVLGVRNRTEAAVVASELQQKAVGQTPYRPAAGLQRTGGPARLFENSPNGLSKKRPVERSDKDNGVS